MKKLSVLIPTICSNCKRSENRKKELVSKVIRIIKYVKKMRN